MAEQATTVDSRFAEVNGTTLHYLVAGPGDPVLLLHGYAQTSHLWRPLIAELAKTQTVIAPDLRGFGQSAKPDGGYEKKTLAQDIHALARSLGHKRDTVAGHDIGLMVAYALRRAIPGRGDPHRLDGCLPARRRRLDDRLAAARPLAFPILRQRRWRWSRAASASTSSILERLRRRSRQVRVRGRSSGSMRRHTRNPAACARASRCSARSSRTPRTSPASPGPS